jgi:hypothetical protein
VIGRVAVFTYGLEAPGAVHVRNGGDLAPLLLADRVDRGTVCCWSG